MNEEIAELAKLIFVIDNMAASDPSKEWDDCKPSQRRYAYSIADGLIAAGYRRTV